MHRKVIQHIAMDNRPFSIVEDEGFIRLMAHAQPRYKVPSRRFITELLEDEYDSVRKIIQAEVDSADSISFTSDGWSDPSKNLNFQSLTG